MLEGTLSLLATSPRRLTPSDLLQKSVQKTHHICQSSPNPEQTGGRETRSQFGDSSFCIVTFSLLLLSSRRLCSTSSDGAKEEEESRKGRATPEDEKDAAALRHGNRGCDDGDDDDDDNEDDEVDAGATDGNGEFTGSIPKNKRY